MARVLTNNISLRYVRENALGIPHATEPWTITQPNTIGSYGAKIKTVARDPISNTRQRRKGSVVDLDSMVEFKADLTGSSFTEFLEAFLFAKAVNNDMVIAPTAVASATTFTVPALTAAQANKLQFVATDYASLVYTRAFTSAANNGPFALGADNNATDTTITIVGALVTESAPAHAMLELAGVRCKTANLAITRTGATAVITKDNNATTSAIDFTTLGLTPGQFIHVGGKLPAQQFSNGAGYGRVTAVTATSISLDKLSDTLITDTGAGDTVDLLFGRYFRNVAVDHPDYLTRSYTFENALPDLGGIGVPNYIYAYGNYCGELEIELPLTNKAMVDFKFIGTNANPPTAVRAANASTALPHTMETAFGTSSDIARLRIANVDDSGLSTDFRSMKIKLNNSVSPDKVIGNLGAKFMNTGNIEVSFDATLIFTEADVLAAIRTNRTVTVDFMLKNMDASFMVDIPSLTLGDGDLEFPVNKSVDLKASGDAFEDGVYHTSFSASMFPYAP